MILDESGSIGWENFEVAKEFISGMVGELSVDNGATQFALVTFSTEVTKQFSYMMCKNT